MNVPNDFVEVASADSPDELDRRFEEWLTSRRLTRDELDVEDVRIEHIRTSSGGGLSIFVRRGAFEIDKP